MAYTKELHELPKRTRRLVSVIQESGDVIKTDDVVAILSVGRTKASQLLAGWMRQGWMRRVGRGAYVAAGIDMIDSPHVLAEPWVLVPALYAPAYIAGRTATEYWDLTDQVFRDVTVMTARPVPKPREERDGMRFCVHHIQSRRIFGMHTVWCGTSKVLVSDLPRTIVDILHRPDTGGGMQQVFDCFREYLKHPKRDDAQLIAHAERFGNGAVFKRMGFLAEQSGAEALRDACSGRLTQGTAKLEPHVDSPRLVARWRLWLPGGWEVGADDREA